MSMAGVDFSPPLPYFKVNMQKNKQIIKNEKT